MSISFIEAARIVSEPNSLPVRAFTLATSGQTEKLEVFIKALCIQNGVNADYLTLPFNTLQQYVASAETPSDPHVFVLFPWDLLPQADWRTGIPATELNEHDMITQAMNFVDCLNSFPERKLIYIPAPLPPLTLNHTLCRSMEKQLEALLIAQGAVILEAGYFSLTSYLSNGSPFSGKTLFQIAEAIVQGLMPQSSEAKKLLVTDFDNVLWKGVIGEDGIDGIRCENEGAGFAHHIYQRFLLKLKNAGVLIAGVSRNDRELATQPFKQGLTLLSESDFVSIAASYHSKSSQIEQLAQNLNLGLDSLVFVDDNPVEIAEVSLSLPTVTCVQFPNKTEMLPDLLSGLQAHFNIQTITQEDKRRTELYQQRALVVPASDTKGADLGAYLSSLGMKLTVEQCHANNFMRALQLINKTNQFNLNGHRITEQALKNHLQDGAQLHVFSILDKFGDHGQIACILSLEDKILQFVMSCRVFQREVEHACMHWFIQYSQRSILEMNFSQTARNLPFQMYLEESCFSRSHNGDILLDTSRYLENHARVVDLFQIEVLSDGRL